jgi:hypothetical protein
MAAYAEGISVLRNANVGKQANSPADAETTPLRDPEHYQYDMNLRDIAEVWRRGSVIASWLLDLTAAALLQILIFRSFPAEFPTQAKVDGQSRRRSTKQYQPRFSPPRFTSDSALGAKLNLLTSSYQRCAVNLADTWRNPTANPK